MKAKLLLGVCLLFANHSLLAQLQAVPADQRPADRDAVMEHLAKIFQGFIHQDAQALREGHSKDWRGFLTGSRGIGKGIDDYMKGVSGALTSPVHMASYRILESDLTFYGDIALLPYVVELESTAGQKQKLRIFDVFGKLNGEWVQIGTNTSVHPEQVALQMSQASELSPAAKKNLLDAREAVWRAWFANNRSELENLLSPETLAIDPESNKFESYAEILDGARRFSEGGGKLVRLEFPQTQIQVYGNTAIVYSTYELETESNGQQHASKGRATETFVFRDGRRWVNTGWHLDAQH